ncbi:MAG: histone deacetylase [Acidobacteriia bacterium]|nr:histone deacetylase [Terriglobia bacterium]
MTIIYSDRYDLNLGDHVFPTVKYRKTKERVLADGLCSAPEMVSPPPADDEQVALVHSREYIRKLRKGKLSTGEILRMEVPYSREGVDAVWLSTGGTIAAARCALTEGISVNLGGGFHHAFPDHGEGFCMLNDVAVAIRALQKESVIRTAMTVDCDVHHGNGTAEIFHADPTVFTLSIHQLHNYPAIKPPSNLDIDLQDGTGDEEYLEKLSQGLDKSLGEFKPDFIVYLAGADPYRYDQLGGLSLTLQGLFRRDELVFRMAREKSIPVAVTLAGGYAYRVEDTVTIHTNTVRAAKDVFTNQSS